MKKYAALLLLSLQAHAQDVCVNTFQAFNDCTDKASCSCELFPVVQTNLFQSTSLCSSLLESVCVAKTCCESSCREEYRDYEDCIHEFLAVSSVHRCDIHCLTATDIPAMTFSIAPQAADVPTPVPADWFERQYSSPVSAPADHDCARDYLAATSCVSENEAQCSNCEITGPPGQTVDLEFCENVTSSTCAMQHCCGECRDSLENYAYCIQDYVLDVTNGDCELDCSPVESEAPSVSPMGYVFPTSTNATDQGFRACTQQLNDAASCIGSNGCPNCFLEDLPENDDPKFCTKISDIACSESVCCAACEQQLDAYEACLSIYASVTTSGQCEIDCQPSQPVFVEGPQPTDDSGTLRITMMLWLPSAAAVVLVFL